MKDEEGPGWSWRARRGVSAGARNGGGSCATVLLRRLTEEEENGRRGIEGARAARVLDLLVRGRRAGARKAGGSDCVTTETVRRQADSGSLRGP